MGRFDKGVGWYTTGKAIITINFPEDAVACFYCPYCRADNMDRRWCRLTGELIYTKDTISDSCPIVFEEE